MPDTDPYSTAMATIADELDRVLNNEELNGQMSDIEYSSLCRLAMTMIELDPDLSARFTMKP